MPITTTELSTIGSYINLGNDATDTSIAQTVLAYAKRTGASQGAFGYLFGRTLPSSLSGHRFFVADSGSRIAFGGSSSGNVERPYSNGGDGANALDSWAFYGAAWSGETNAESIKYFFESGGEVVQGSGTANLFGTSGTVIDAVGKELYLLNRPGIDRAFNGSVAYVARWSRVLSLAEVQQVKAQGPLSVPSGLILCWANGQDYGPKAYTPVARSTFVAGELPPNTNLGGTLDTTAPTLTSPSASATGATTASGSVTTNEGNGTLYYLASVNATELLATVKAGSSQAVSASGAQNVTLTGLTASTNYYLHFAHTDSAANDSAVASSAQFTTSALDTTPPTLTGPTGTATGATSASGTVSTNEATGTLYYLASANASETGTTVKAGSSQAVSATGTQNVTVSGLAASTAYYLHYLHRDASGNDSTVATSAQFTTSATSDTTVPTMTGVVTFASITQTTYTAQWTAGSDNVAVTGYEYQIGSTAGAWTDAGNNLSAAITGRTAGTTETVYVRAYDAAGNRSTPAISGEVTLAVAQNPIKGIEITLHNGAEPHSSVSGITALWWDAPFPWGAPVLETATASTDAAGSLVLDLDAVTGLAIDGYGYLLLHKPGTLGAGYRDAMAFAGAVQVSDIS